MEDPEQRLSEALRARASQTSGGPAVSGFGQQAPAQPLHSSAAFPPAPQRGPVPARDQPATGPRRQIGWALGIALLAGAVLGCALALLSVLVPGLLPALG